MRFLLGIFLVILLEFINTNGQNFGRQNYRKSYPPKFFSAENFCPANFFSVEILSDKVTRAVVAVGGVYFIHVMHASFYKQCKPKIKSRGAPPASS